MKMPTLAQRIAWEQHVEESKRMQKRSAAQQMKKTSATQPDVPASSTSVVMPIVEEDEDYVVV
jgi:hypothetical protein